MGVFHLGGVLPPVCWGDGEGRWDFKWFEVRASSPHMGGMKQVWILLLSLIVLTFGILAYVQRSISPPVETIVASSLQSLHEQNRLSAFAARFVTVVTSRKERARRWLVRCLAWGGCPESNALRLSPISRMPQGALPW